MSRLLQLLQGGPGFSYQCSSLAEDRFLLPAEGEDIKLLPHGSHNAEDVMDCSDCGEALADYLELCLSKCCCCFCCVYVFVVGWLVSVCVCVCE